ncbi:unnamed protein product [Sphagnum tenellum]
MTIFAVMTALLFPVIHTGRPWYAIFWLLPYPNQRHLWVNFRSPLLWDVFAVGTYFTISSVFWFTGLIPDLASIRDRAKNPIRKMIYTVLSLGWRGSNKNWGHYEIAYMLLAGLSTPLVLSVHSVVSFDFAVSNLPGWHTTIFPPYFVAGAIFSGFAMVVTLLVIAREVFNLKNYITIPHLEKMNKIIMATGMTVGYAYACEFFIAWYSGSPYERFAFINRAFGPYWWAYWTMISCNVIIPQLFWFKKCRTSIPVMFVVSLFVNIGVIGYFDDPEGLVEATRQVREARYSDFDTYTPFPIHDLLTAQGLERSPLPFITFSAGITGCTLGFLLQYWTSAVDWPLNIAGKPFNSLPAFVPVMFECTILFAGLSTVAGMFIINHLPNNKRKAFDPSLTRDRFAIVIEPPDQRSPKAGFKAFNEAEAQEFLKKVGAKDVKRLFACRHEQPNVIYMPDMVYSPAIKAQKQGSMRMPVPGTVERNFESYPYPNDPELAGKELKNPLLPAASNLKRGKHIYESYCIVCHGKEATGNGSIVPPYPQPPNLHSEKVRNWPDGSIYHVITMGQNLMPSYASQIAPGDRWEVINYIRALQRSKNPTAEDVKAFEKESE